MKSIPHLLALCTLLCSTLLAAKKPNIIFIMADDLGYGDLSCYGSTTVKTPHLDALAASGVKCLDFHSNGTVCSPSRSAFFTGRYQQRTGITGVVTAAKHRDTGLPLDEWTVAEAMKEQGYQTALFGKWHLGYKQELNPVHQGFDQFNGFVSGNVDYHNHIDLVGIQDWYQQDQLNDEPGYITDLITKHTLDFIEEHQDKPFFIVAMHGAPHAPYQGRDTPPFRKLGKGGQDQGLSNEEKKAAFIDMIEVMDEGLGKIVAKLDTLNLRENTLIVFCSDNGPATYGSSGPFKGRKGSLYEGGHRVCGIFNWKGTLPSNSECTVPILGSDMLPTFFAMADGKISEQRVIDGKNILPALMTNNMQREPLFWGYKSGVAIRVGDYKLIQNKKNSALYNLRTDPSEKQNIAKSHPERVKEMRALIEVWKQEVARP